MTGGDDLPQDLRDFCFSFAGKSLGRGRALAELGAVLGLEGDGVVGHEALLADEAGPGAPRLMVVRLGATTRSTARYHHVDHGCAPSQGASLAGATWARLRHGRAPRTAGRRWGTSPEGADGLGTYNEPQQDRTGSRGRALGRAAPSLPSKARPTLRTREPQACS